MQTPAKSAYAFLVGPQNLFTTLWRAANSWVDHGGATMSAAVAFFAAFSLAPMLVLVIAVAGRFYGVEAVQGRLFHEIAGLIGHDGSLVIQTMVSNAWKADRSGLTAVISGVLIFIGASATFAELYAAVNLVWDGRKEKTIPATRDFRSVAWGLLRVRLLSLALVIGVAFLLLTLLVLDAVFDLLIHWLWATDDSGFWLAASGQQIIALAMLTLVFASLLWLLPLHRPRKREVFYGAMVAALLFTLGRRLFGLYLAHAGTADVFGAAGSLAVVLMWLYYSAAVFLYGACTAAALTPAGPQPSLRTSPCGPGIQSGDGKETAEGKIA